MSATVVSASPGTAQSPAGSPANEFLSFRLGSEEYGIEILKVQEIRGWEQPTRISSAPKFIKGVINLRGTIVPIVDLRLKFELGRADYDQFTVVIIVNACERTVGVVVDSVSDVVALAPDQFRPAPPFAAAVGSDFIMGLGSIDEKMLILIDIEKLISSPDMALFEAVQ